MITVMRFYQHIMVPLTVQTKNGQINSWEPFYFYQISEANSDLEITFLYPKHFSEDMLNMKEYNLLT